MKRLALAITLISSAALLSGCIIVPPRHGHGHHRGHGHHYQQSDRYEGGGHHHRGSRVYEQTGPRRW